MVSVSAGWLRDALRALVVGCWPWSRAALASSGSRTVSSALPLLACGVHSPSSGVLGSMYGVVVVVHPRTSSPDWFRRRRARALDNLCRPSPSRPCCLPLPRVVQAGPVDPATRPLALWALRMLCMGLRRQRWCSGPGTSWLVTGGSLTPCVRATAWPHEGLLGRALVVRVSSTRLVRARQSLSSPTW